MALNLDVVGKSFGSVTHSWDSKDAILYALGVGAGLDELQFTTENSRDFPQKVLPTFSVVGEGSSLLDLLGEIGSFDLTQLLHAEQSIRLFGSIPVSATVNTVSEIVGIYDKITGASVVVKSTTSESVTNKVLFETTATLFIRGEGSFGGPRGERTKPLAFPESGPDHVITYETLPTQALIYRLSGDRNPLHSDPSFAHEAGFDRPILHGLCTLGFAGRALLHKCCDSNPERFGDLSVRFVAPVYPGDLLTTSIWDIGGSVLFKTENQSGVTVLDRGQFKYLTF